MPRKPLLVMTALAAMLFAARPNDAEASLELSSSMEASCVTSTCDLVKFVLSVPDQIVSGTPYSNMLVDVIRIFSGDTNVFQFGAVQEVWHFVSGVKTTLWAPTGTWNWSANVNPTGDLSLAGSTVAATEPVFLLVNMVKATPSQLIDGTLTYFANGYVNGTVGATNGFSTQGQVTPEPVSMLLLGSGLAGVAGAARRRRRQSADVA